MTITTGRFSRVAKSLTKKLGVIGTSHPPTPSTRTTSNRWLRIVKRSWIFSISISMRSIRAATEGATGDWSHIGFISSTVTSSALAASSRRTSARSPQQMGFIPTARIPASRSNRKSSMATNVLPTPVSVPARNKLTPLRERVRRRLFAPSKGRSLRHQCCQVVDPRHDPDEASVRKHSPFGCRCPRCFQLSRSDWLRA